MHLAERCPECPSRKLELGRKHVVSGNWDGQGHTPHILFIFEAPGREENNRHKILVGKTGEELNETYLPCSGLSRSSVSLTNTVKCHWADSSDAPPDQVIKSCSEFHLRAELDYYNPDIVVLCGAVANGLLGLDVELEHGKYRQAELLGWKGLVYSTNHPAMGLHQSSKMKALLDDFRLLRSVIAGERKQPVDSIYTDFYRITDASDVVNVMKGAFQVAVDTESKKRWRGYKSTIKYIPFCATFSVEVGSGFMIKVEDEDCMRVFFEYLAKVKRAIFHNQPYDYHILEMIADGMGTELSLEWGKCKDTMAMAYHDGRLPKGLKPLSYKLLGKRMTSFDEVVIPHSRQVAINYLAEAMLMDWPKPVQEPTGELVERNCTECKGKGVLTLGRGKSKRTYRCDCNKGKVIVPKMTRKQSMNDKLFRLATDMKRNPDTDIWQRWEGWDTDVQPLIEKLGPIPLPSIEYVPEDEAIAYACGDAHETLRIYPILEQRLIGIRREVRI